MQWNNNGDSNNNNNKINNKNNNDGDFNTNPAQLLSNSTQIIYQKMPFVKIPNWNFVYICFLLFYFLKC